MIILGIESSCDETAAAVVEDGRKLLSSAVASQIPEHRLYGGVVPEIASRLHVENTIPVTEQALNDAGLKIEDVDAIAVTAWPGLIGALLVGVNYAKGLSMASGKPLVPVHHLRGHIAALYLTHPELKPPFVVLVASGGHSHLIKVKSYTDFEILGRAVDDAAGEAFDKVARALGLNYPGGPEIARLALDGDPNKYKLPEPHVDGEYDVSFSGLKTAVINIINTANMKGELIDAASLAASFQRTASEMLARRLSEAAAKENLPACICGGVAANTTLRLTAQRDCRKKGIELLWPDLSLCGDNAAMIASAGYYEYMSGNIADMSLNAKATKEIQDTPFGI